MYSSTMRQTDEQRGEVVGGRGGGGSVQSFRLP